MSRPSLSGKVARLFVLLITAAVYIFWMTSRLPLTRHAHLDGSIGVLVGLYVCSHPATSFVDLLFFGRHAPESQLPAGKLTAWIALNLIVFFFGVLMITIGATRFV